TSIQSFTYVYIITSGSLTHAFTTQTNNISLRFLFFFFNDTATTEIYTLSLHDALPIFERSFDHDVQHDDDHMDARSGHRLHGARLEEHTSELQSRSDLVCRLLLEKKKKKNKTPSTKTSYRYQLSPPS